MLAYLSIYLIASGGSLEGCVLAGLSDCVHSDELESCRYLAGQQFGWESAHMMQRVGKTTVQLSCGCTM